LDILPKINVNPDEVIKMVSYDKKKIGNSINFTLLKDIANPVIYDGVEKFQIEKAIKKYVN
jgi:3-dehydroquinate synthetase